MNNSEKFKNIAVLIDAENAQMDSIKPAINRIVKYGEIILKEAYGDWSKPHLANWKSICKDNNIEQVMQSGDTKGKNATDISLVIAAMDHLHQGNFDAFVIFSSDSDYTPLIYRIHKKAIKTIVVGKCNAAKALKKRCDVFIAEEDLVKPKKEKTKTPDISFNADKIIKEAYDDAILNTKEDDGWIDVVYIDAYLNKNEIKFSIKKTCNCKSFTTYIKQHQEHYEFKYSGSRNSVPKFRVKKGKDQTAQTPNKVK